MLNELAKEIHENAVAHGWWDEKRSFGDIVALCHSELSEALEEYRANRTMVWHDCDIDAMCEWETKVDDSDCPADEPCDCPYYHEKPEGIAVEMIDCIIRILDWCGKEGLDVDAILQVKHEYNKTRPYRHGGKVL